MPKEYWGKQQRTTGGGDPEIQLTPNRGAQARSMPEISPKDKFCSKLLEEVGDGEVFKLALNSDALWKIDERPTEGKKSWKIFNLMSQETMMIRYHSHRVYCFDNEF